MATTTKRPLNESPRYKEFIRQRDLALEALLHKAQYRLTDQLAGILQRSMEIISYWYVKSQSSHMMLKTLEQDIEHVFFLTIPEIKNVILDLRRQSYILSHAGEVEAMSRSLGRPKQAVLSKTQINNEEGNIDGRIKLYLDRIKRKILDAVQLSALQEDLLPDMIARVSMVLPKITYVKRPEKVLKKPVLKEAGPFDMRKNSLSTGFVDENEWDKMVEEYTSEYIPVNRGPDGELDVQLGEGTPKYEWELERDMTHDFVQEVRRGQVDAAKQNGITDFIWIAVIDAKTDECCVIRDGKTISEIEQMISNGEIDDDCGTSVPAHMGCRCSIAPMTDEMPESPPDKIGEFEDWLNSST